MSRVNQGVILSVRLVDISEVRFNCSTIFKPSYLRVVVGAKGEMGLDNKGNQEERNFSSISRTRKKF